ncbi:MAG TPA: branched-chain amino acid ABC transporter permease [Stackebrandtia sp.]|nr:branched-chain amino acid ABC transporter permease [Stackebrandtia sp.]HZE41776.1 branched-chain amino acid ABC transporter permease [Stackebrandtia sp.]
MTGLTYGGIYALVALGYTLVYGVLKLINFAHSEVFMLGTFGAIGVWGVLGFNDATATPSLLMFAVLMLAGTVGAMVASGGTALALEYIAYRPLRRKRAPRLVFLITAIGCSLALLEGMGVVTDHDTYKAPTLIDPYPILHLNFGPLGTVDVDDVSVGIIIFALLMLAVLDVFINRSRTGAGVRAVAQDADTAALMGINKNRIFALTFLLGGIAAGLAAALYDVYIGNTINDVGFILGIKAFTAAVLGGIGNLRGALVGGFLLGLVEQWAGALFGNAWLDVVAFIILVVVLMFKPTGLLGESLGRAKA